MKTPDSTAPHGRGLHRVAALTHDDAQVLDVVGPLEVSRASRWLEATGRTEVPVYDVEILTQLADILLQGGDRAEAGPVAERILRREPDHARARAILSESRGEKEEGEE